MSQYTIKNGLDVQTILADQIEKFLNGEIKSDALNSVSSAMKALSMPAMGKLKQASINKEKVNLKFFDCDL